jgi:hypothetical protein
VGERGTERAAADGRAGVGTVAGQVWLQAKVGFGMSGQGELCELGGSTGPSGFAGHGSVDFRIEECQTLQGE